MPLPINEEDDALRKALDDWDKEEPVNLEKTPSSIAERITQKIHAEFAAVVGNIISDDPSKPICIKTEKGQLRPVQQNTQIALAFSGIRPRYNEVTKDVEIVIPGHGGTVDNILETSFSKALDACHIAGYPIADGTFARHLLAIADENIYNPFRTWVLSVPWDGKSRIQAFYDSITAKGDKAEKELGMMRWCMGVLAAGFHPQGCGGALVLVFVGSQGIGKSRWCAGLLPSELGLVGEGSINPDDKDSVNQAIGYLIYELGELDGTFRKSDIAKLKAFLSRNFDQFRRPYARNDSKYVRRTVFVGTVNHAEFLADTTGNRRYYPLHVETVKQLPNDAAWKQQLWRELYNEYFLKGEPWHLTPEELANLNERNTSFTPIDPIEERLLAAFNFDVPCEKWATLIDARPATATAICDAISIDADMKSTKAVARIIKGHWKGDGEADVRTSRGRLLHVPPRR